MPEKYIAGKKMIDNIKRTTQHVEKFQIFHTVFDDEELENDFHNFFYKYALTPLFTNEHRAGEIRVSYVEARGTINPGGAYHEPLKEFSSFLLMYNNNKRYEDTLFRILYESRSVQRMVNIIKKIIILIESILEEHIHNMWNIVFYDDEVWR